MSKDTTYVVIQDADTVTNEAAMRRIQRGDDVPEEQRETRRLAVGEKLKPGDLPAIVITSLLANRAIAPASQADEANAALVLEYGPLRMVSDAPGQEAQIGVQILSEKAAKLIDAALNGGAAPAWTEETFIIADDTTPPAGEGLAPPVDTQPPAPDGEVK